MISRLPPTNILNRIAQTALSKAQPGSRSWFLQVRDICTKYSLPSAVSILQSPLSKASYKTLIRGKVFDFWERKLRADVEKLPSLQYFKPQFYSLKTPHPIWTCAGNNPYEVEKASCQARMLSGRYRTCWLARHWSGDSSGSCLLPSCHLTPSPGTLTHILLECVDLAPARQRTFSLWAAYLRDKPLLLPIIKHYTMESDSNKFLQFILDCTVLPDVITLRQQEGKWVHDSLLYLTRTLCFSVHKSGEKLL